jgi:hypothetical protein
MTGMPDPSEPLQAHIDWWTKAGWDVVSQAPGLATLRKRHQAPLTRILRFFIREDTGYRNLRVEDGLVSTTIY